jgi:hypothetical protein
LNHPGGKRRLFLSFCKLSCVCFSPAAAARGERRAAATRRGLHLRFAGEDSLGVPPFSFAPCIAEPNTVTMCIWI